MPKSHIPLLLALSLLFYVLAATSMAQKSMTFDESAHLVSGYSAWKSREQRLNPEHPPLVKMLAALPFVLKHSFNLETYPAWREARQWDLAHDLLWQKSVDTDQILFRCRFMLLIFGPLSALAVYFYALKIWGASGALFSFIAAILCPNLIAHAQIIHNDVPLTFFFILFSLCALHYEEKPTRRNAFFLALTLGLALITKYSAILLWPLALGFFIFSNRRRWRAWSEDATGALKREFVLQLLLLLILPLFLMSWIYGHIFNLSPYLDGLAMVNYNRTPNYDYFMNGHFSRQGFWFYYPFAMLIKMPLPTLILCLLGSLSIRKKQKLFWVFLTLPGLLLLLVLSVGGVNIGVRHILPLFPLLFVLVGGIERFKDWAPVKILAISLCLWLGFESFKIYPDYLAYFNILAGGPNGGIHYLDNSNLDWGQDLKRLPKMLQALHIQEFKMQYAGLERPEDRGIHAADLPPLDRYFPQGDYVVSAHVLARNTLSPHHQGMNFDWLHRYLPAAIIGHTLYIYRFRLDERSRYQNGINYFTKTEWLRDGFKRLQAMNLANPDCRECQELQTQAQAKFGKPLALPPAPGRR